MHTAIARNPKANQFAGELARRLVSKWGTQLPCRPLARFARGTRVILEKNIAEGDAANSAARCCWRASFMRAHTVALTH